MSQYCVEIDTRDMMPTGKVRIIIVKGGINYKSACLRELSQEIEQTIQEEDVMGVVLNLQKCTWIGEEGFGAIAKLIKNGINVACVSGDSKSQPMKKYKITKMSRVAALYDSQEEAIDAIAK